MEYFYTIEEGQLVKERHNYGSKKEPLLDEKQKDFQVVFMEILDRLSDMQEKLESMERDLGALKSDLDERERVNKQRYGYSSYEY